jgi:hypothetical protein
MKPLPAPPGPGNAESDRFDNAFQPDHHCMEGRLHQGRGAIKACPEQDAGREEIKLITASLSRRYEL